MTGVNWHVDPVKPFKQLHCVVIPLKIKQVPPFKQILMGHNATDATVVLVVVVKIPEFSQKTPKINYFIAKFLHFCQFSFNIFA